MPEQTNEPFITDKFCNFSNVKRAFLVNHEIFLKAPVHGTEKTFPLRVSATSNHSEACRVFSWLMAIFSSDISESGSICSREAREQRSRHETGNVSPEIFRTCSHHMNAFRRVIC